MKFVSLRLLDGTVCEVPESVFNEIQELRSVANDAMEEEEKNKKDMGHKKKKDKGNFKDKDKDKDKEDEDDDEDKKKDEGMSKEKDLKNKPADSGYDVVENIVFLQAQNDALKAKLRKAESRKEKAKQDSELRENIAFYSKAAKVLNKNLEEVAKHDSFTVKKACIKKTLGLDVEGKQEAYIDAMFDICAKSDKGKNYTNLMDKAVSAVDSLSQSQKVDNLTNDMGGMKPPDIDKEKLNSYLAKKKDAWKMPLNETGHGISPNPGKLKGKELE